MDSSLVAMLTSRYAAERAIGVRVLLKKADESGLEDEDFFAPWLSHDLSLVRYGAALALAQNMDAARAIPRMLEVVRQEPLVTRRESLACLAFSAAYDSWYGPMDFFDGEEGISCMKAAAWDFASKKIKDLADCATLTTSFLPLGKFASMGPYGVSALARIAGSKLVDAGQRALAMSALSRMNSQNFWEKENSGLAPGIIEILEDQREYIKINALFSMAYLGIHGSQSIEAIKSYALHDAYSAESIEAALYFLYTLSSDVAKREAAQLTEVAKEYLDGAYSSKVRYNAGILLAQVNIAPLFDQAVAMIKESPDFASYWALGALLNRSGDLPEAIRASKIKELSQWVLASEEAAPQLKGMVAWFYSQREKKLPGDLTLAFLTDAILESIEKVYTESEDPNHLAKRSGLDILAHLKSPKIKEPLRLALAHKNEAVRMAAGLAAGASGFKDLIPNVYKAMLDGQEFAAFGIAWGLNELGDKRAHYWLSHYLMNGIACLMPSALAALRKSTGLIVADDIPMTPNSWRLRGRAWCELLKSSGN